MALGSSWERQSGRSQIQRCNVSAQAIWPAQHTQRVRTPFSPGLWSAGRPARSSSSRTSLIARGISQSLLCPETVGDPVELVGERPADVAEITLRGGFCWSVVV